MSLTIEEIGLLRKLVEWRRKNGWARAHSRENQWSRYSHGTGLLVDVEVYRHEDGTLDCYELVVEDGKRRLGYFFPRSVSSAVNQLATFELIPPEMAPLHQAGKASALKEERFRVSTCDDFDDPEVFTDRASADEELARLAHWDHDEFWIEHCLTGATAWKRVES